MKLTLERDALHAALGRVAKIVERRNTVPILSHLHLEARHDADGAALHLRGADLDIEVTTRVPADVAMAGRATAPGSLLADVVAKLPSGAQLRLEHEGSSLVMRSGRGRASLHTLAPDDFPLVPAVVPSHAFEIEAAALLRLLGKTAFAISSEEARYYLNGTFLHAPAADGGGAVLRAVATDGHRLAQCQCAAPEGAAGMPGIIVPKKATAEIRRLAKEAEAPIAVRLDARRLEATIPGKGGATVLATKLIEGTFPDYQRIMPLGNDKRAVLERVACMDAAERVACISRERGRAAKLAFADGALVLSVKSPDHGDAADEIEIDYAAAPIEIGFNAGYLGDVLATLDGDRVAVEMAEPGAPTLFRETQQGDDLLLVLMPMRV